VGFARAYVSRLRSEPRPALHAEACDVFVYTTATLAAYHRAWLLLA
jgi:hypothetical protein